ncbi:DUF2017 family protein [Microbacterium sp. ZXX196]|uniref:DUF2017 family protein n=1 Tax=Microbacterium sp. ZXX196 TaxID=2609291 RepID=UPI0012B6CCC4|nr:DUF2017 family protein [Microbacterium sp. ZXX196]MTE23715.1 DUF2017 family protein [Microbacterium sp. ZXX196]
MTDRLTILTLTRIEARHLADLIDQFATLVADGRSEDPALGRLTPDAYPEDDAASREFRDVTRTDLLGRRAGDARVVAEDLERIGDAGLDDALSPVDVSIAGDRLDAWLRTLAALRLVLASRLGISDGDAAHDEDDPRYGLYEWLGYRLEGLVQAADGETSA